MRTRNWALAPHMYGSRPPPLGNPGSSTGAVVLQPAQCALDRLALRESRLPLQFIVHESLRLFDIAPQQLLEAAQ